MSELSAHQAHGPSQAKHRDAMPWLDGVFSWEPGSCVAWREHEGLAGEVVAKLVSRIRDRAVKALRRLGKWWDEDDAAAGDAEADGEEQLLVSSNKIAEADMVLGAVAPNPMPRSQAARSLVGKKPSERLFQRAAEMAFQGSAPLAHNAWKLPIGKAVVRAALEEATR